MLINFNVKVIRATQRIILSARNKTRNLRKAHVTGSDPATLAINRPTAIRY